MKDRIHEFLANGYLTATSIIKFDCFKSYEETTTYLQGVNKIRLGYLYHYSTLTYDADSEIPKPAEDGNYYNLPEPLKAICGDIWKTITEIHVGDFKLRAKVKSFFEEDKNLEMDDFLLTVGFKPTHQNMIYSNGVQVTKLSF
ncbi:hypothetical protein [Polynucleobacter sp. AP-Nino-20-G2]|uniref:hypothetical protein n=1 Tax=Polynucleobacter sp. AP-Nino-20-G2 TaxID=2576917 RepID=UPI001BFE8FB3|nr:hypothetical protein [Polynucleobacter sp. AP-Nino-20-G2]QWE16649.1 hypothetical protein FD960_10355 [Polynucleobacter sp. AP-Nino-20-G2]